VGVSEETGSVHMTQVEFHLMVYRHPRARSRSLTLAEVTLLLRSRAVVLYSVAPVDGGAVQDN